MAQSNIEERMLYFPTCLCSSLVRSRPAGIMSEVFKTVDKMIVTCDKDRDNPQQAGEENVKGAEQQEKPPDRRHPTTMLSTRHQVICHDDGEWEGTITTS